MIFSQSLDSRTQTSSSDSFLKKTLLPFFQFYLITFELIAFDWLFSFYYSLLVLFSTALSSSISQTNVEVCLFSGGEYRSRTDDLLLAKQAL